jgi:HK97 family phage portal protein
VAAAEVTDHPLLDLFRTVNPEMNAFDLWELTQLYLEVTGLAYWLLDLGSLGIPQMVWPLPAQNVFPWRAPDSPALVDYYEYRSTTGAVERYLPDQIIAFSIRDLRDPYRRGFGPMRGAFESVTLLSEMQAFKTAKFRNHAIPDAMLTPDEVIGDTERERLEQEWNLKLRRGGAGRVIVADSKMDLKLLSHSMADMAQLAQEGATREEIATAFGVPLPYVSRETNLANLQAADLLHAKFAIRPRVRRRDEKLNERLIPFYDPTGRLFLHSDDPVPDDKDFALKRRNSSVQLGIMGTDEARLEMGLPPRGDDHA